MSSETAEPIADDRDFWPIYIGSRVRVEPGLSAKMGIEVPPFQGHVLSIDDDGALRIREEGSQAVRAAWPGKCRVMRPKRRRA